MSDDRLNWLAMQYVLGELPEQERHAFEERLMDDLAACEAVAKASRFQLTLRRAIKETAPAIRIQRIPATSPGRSWVGVGAAIVTLACSFVVAMFWTRESGMQWHSHFVQVSDPGREFASDDARLISMWSSGLSEPEPESGEGDEGGQDFSADDAIPGWLLAGVSLETNGVINGALPDRKDN